jgi:hypothetical protein
VSVGNEFGPLIARHDAEFSPARVMNDMLELVDNYVAGQGRIIERAFHDRLLSDDLSVLTVRKGVCAPHDFIGARKQFQTLGFRYALSSEFEDLHDVR